MGLFDALKKLTGSGPQLAQADATAPVHEVEQVSVSTAQALIIVAVTADAVPHIRRVADSGQACTLHSAGQKVFFQAAESLPVKDSKKGWLIALDKSTREAIVSTLRPEPGDYELTERLAIVVEETA